MPRRLAGGYLILLSLTLLVLGKIKSYQGEKGGKDNKDGENSHPPIESSGAVSHLSPQTIEPNEGSRKKKEESYWFWSKIGAAVGGFATIGAAIFAYAAFYESKRQADIGQDGLRPWVSVTMTFDGPVTVGTDNTGVNVGFDLKNVGHSPALDVDVYYDIRPYPIAGIPPVEENEFCAVEHALGHIQSGHLMFPDETYPIHHTTFVIANTYIKDAALKDKDGRFSLVIVGCATYRIHGDSSAHQTPFVYQIYRWTIEHPTAMTSFRNIAGIVGDTDSLRSKEMFVNGREPN